MSGTSVCIKERMANCIAKTDKSLEKMRGAMQEQRSIMTYMLFLMNNMEHEFTGYNQKLVHIDAGLGRTAKMSRDLSDRMDELAGF